MESTKTTDRRHERMMEAGASERKRMNTAIANGAVVTTDTFLGPQRVKYVSADWWYHTPGRSWCGCNDGDWARMMEQAGLERHSLFA